MPNDTLMILALVALAGAAFYFATAGRRPARPQPPAQPAPPSGAADGPHLMDLLDTTGREHAKAELERRLGAIRLDQTLGHLAKLTAATEPPGPK